MTDSIEMLIVILAGLTIGGIYRYFKSRMPATHQETLD